MITIIDIPTIKLCSINNKYVNRAYALTPEYRSFKILIKAMAKRQKLDPPLKVEIYAQTGLDIDATIKPLLDGLEDVTYDNDKDIYDLHIYKQKIKRGGSGRLVVKAMTIDEDEHNSFMKGVFDEE